MDPARRTEVRIARVTAAAKTAAAIACVLSALASSATAATFYVDSKAGNDAADGRNISSPWRTLSKVNATTLLAGDSVLLRRGSMWAETLELALSGRSDAPITIGAYGIESARPLIDGRGLQALNIQITAGSFITIRDLELRRKAKAPKARLVREGKSERLPPHG